MRDITYINRIIAKARKNRRRFMKNKTYDALKWTALTGLPATIVFYGVLGATLGLPYTQEVITIAVAADALLGTWLGISSVQYAAKK
jgi:hypothetical protein